MIVTLRALSPIVHGEYTDGIDTGNISQFRKMQVVHDGELVSVPVLSGNSTRGLLRRLVARELIDRFGLKDQMGGTFDKFYVAIANGGNLDKNMDVSEVPKRLREIRQMLPALSVFGASLYKYMLSGMVNIGFAMPRCKELGTGEQRATDLLSDIGLVRHLDREIASDVGAKPMPYTVETVAAGAIFDLSVEFAPQSTAAEQAAVMHGFKLMNTVGGKASVGFGKVSVETEVDDTAYVGWLESQTEDDIAAIVDFARSL